MMTHNPGTIVFLDYPYAIGGKSKARPALVVLDSGDADIVVAKITSQTRTSNHDVPVIDWVAAGLRLPSIVRLHKLVTVEKALVLRTLGSLSSPDRKAVGGVLSSLFSGW